MSTKAQAWVWDNSETNGNDRLVLLFLADQGDDDGTNSFPSMRRIAEKCHINVDTVSRVLVRLEDAGEILVERPETQGRGHFNRYTLILGRPIADVEAARSKARDLRPFGAATKRSGKPAESSGTRGPGPRLPIDPQTQDPGVSRERDATPPPVANLRAAGDPQIVEIDAQFAEFFWPVYPERDGKKLDRRKALVVWRRLTLDDRRAVVRGVRHYAASGQRPKDAFRWLRDRCWEDWQTPATVATPSNPGRPSPAATIMAALRQEATS